MVKKNSNISLFVLTRSTNVKKSPFSRTAAHIFVSPGDAPATITQYVACMNWKTIQCLPNPSQYRPTYLSSIITVLPHTLKLDFTGLLLRGGDERGGSGKERERGCPVFSLSWPVNPKHNPCTCRMMLKCFWLESKLWLWIHKPEYNGTMEQPPDITFAISTCLLDSSAERWKRICFDRVCGA